MCLIMAVQLMAKLCINPRWKIMRRLLRVWCWEQKPWISYRGVNLASVGLKRIIQEDLFPTLSLAGHALHKQIKPASTNSTLLLPGITQLQNLFSVYSSVLLGLLIWNQQLAMALHPPNRAEFALLSVLLKCDYPSFVPLPSLVQMLTTRKTTMIKLFSLISPFL